MNQETPRAAIRDVKPWYRSVYEVTYATRIADSGTEPGVSGTRRSCPGAASPGRAGRPAGASGTARPSGATEPDVVDVPEPGIVEVPERVAQDYLNQATLVREPQMVSAAVRRRGGAVALGPRPTGGE